MSAFSAKATITDNGAVLLGKYVACDAFEKFRPLRVVTHAHADHMMGLRQSLAACEKVLMTSATKDLIDVMMGPLFLMGGYVETLEYNKTVRYMEETVTFFPADHILGAAQVLVEDAEGTKIAYTGDFRIEETPVLEVDVLVIEATYGSPSCRRPFEDVKELLVSIVEEGLKHGPVHVFGYHGKLQEVMQILRSAGVTAPFLVPQKVFQVSKVCEKYDMRFGRLLLRLEEKEAKELLEKRGPCVTFYHMGSRGKVSHDSLRVYLSGWEFNSPCREIAENEYIIALSDHSDFDGLMEYVRLSRPKLVITDNFRVGYAETLAKEISKRFNIPALPLPKR